MAVAGLVLAAGAGTRMGGPKALVHDPDGTSWLVRAVSSLADGGCAGVTVVLGAGLDQARSWLRQDTHIFVDTGLDGVRTTFWAGELVVYYSAPESGSDFTTQVRQWAKDVSLCPVTVTACGVSSAGRR